MILRSGVRVAVPILLVFSVFLLLRGHYEPGGGFAGGLVAAAAIVIHGLANDFHDARRFLRVPPQGLLALGLAIALLSGVPGVLLGGSYMSPVWIKVPPGDPDGFPFGTPFVFDIGVYFVVIGMVLSIVLTMAEED